MGLADIYCIGSETGHQLCRYSFKPLQYGSQDETPYSSKTGPKIPQTNAKPSTFYTAGHLHGSVDAGRANDKDRKSVGGYVFLLAGAAISWNLKKQYLVALLTEEAEYTAFTEGSRDVLWIRQLLQEINSITADSDYNTTRTATKIFADNQAAIKHGHSEGLR